MSLPPIVRGIGAKISPGVEPADTDHQPTDHKKVQTYLDLTAALIAAGKGRERAYLGGVTGARGLQILSYCIMKEPTPQPPPPPRQLIAISNRP